MSCTQKSSTLPPVSALRDRTRLPSRTDFKLPRSTSSAKDTERDSAATLATESVHSLASLRVPAPRKRALAPLTSRRRTPTSRIVTGEPVAIPSPPEEPRARARARAASRKRSVSRTSRRRRRKTLRGRSRSKPGSKKASKKDILLPRRSLSTKPKLKIRSRNSIGAGGSKSSSKARDRTSYAPLKVFNHLKRQPLRSPSDQSSGDEGLRSNDEGKQHPSGEAASVPRGSSLAAGASQDIVMVQNTLKEKAPTESVLSSSAVSTLPKPTGNCPDPTSVSPRRVLKRPKLSSSLSVLERLEKIQNFIEHFEYNLDSRAMFISKSRPLSSISECADQIIRKSSPIKCMEAVVLGICLTNDIDKLSRFCLRFKSTVGGRTYWHIVLCMRYRNKFGTLGLSRKSELAFKPIQYNSLFDLVSEFRRCYVEECGHVVHRLTVGLPVGQSNFSKESVHWQYLHLPLNTDFMATESDLLREVLDNYVARCWDIKYALDYSAPIPVVHPDLEATRAAMQLRSKKLRDLRKESQTMLINRANLRQRNTRHEERQQLKYSARTKKFLRANSQSRSLSPQKSTRHMHKNSRFSCPRVNMRPRTQASALYTPRSRRGTTPRGRLQKVSLPVVLPHLDTQRVSILKVP